MTTPRFPSRRQFFAYAVAVPAAASLASCVSDEAAGALDAGLPELGAPDADVLDTDPLAAVAPCGPHLDLVRD
jgi:hypothetical protein